MKNKFLKMILTIACLVTFIPNKVTEVSGEEPTTSNTTTSISDFSIANAETEYSPSTNESDHIVKYSLTLTTSGDEGSVNSVVFEVPKSLFNDRTGNSGDSFQISIPTKDEYTHLTAQGIEVDSPWMYEEKDDKILISSTKPIKVGSTYNIEIGYQLDGNITNFKDGEVSKELKATVTLDTKGGVLKSEAAAEQVTINTNATIQGSRSDTDNVTAFTDVWNDNWGPEPEDVNEYYYSLVRVTSYITGSQPYNISINSKAVDDETGEEFTPYMYNIGLNGWGDKSSEENSKIFEGANGRKDYILYRFPIATYKNREKSKFTVTDEVSTEGIDLIDGPNEVKTSSTNITYVKEPWMPPEGKFITLQNGDNYYRVNHKELEKWSLVNTKIDKYSRYDLQNFQNGTLNKYDNLDFGYFVFGMPMGHSVPKGQDNIPSNYFKESVTYNQFINGISLVNDDDTTISDLNSDDYQIKNISVYTQYLDGKLNINNKYDETTRKPVVSDIVGVYAKYNNSSSEYVHIADYSPLNKTYSNVKDGIDVVGNKLVLDDNVVAYKLTTSNPYYYTKILSGAEYMLKHSDKVDNYVRGKEEIRIASSVNAEMLDNTGKQIYEYTAPTEYDYARKTETVSEITKDVVNVRNNRTSKRYELIWEIKVNEVAKLSNTEESPIEQSGGTWYDLMPAGLVVNEDTVTLYDRLTGQEHSVSVSSTPNYRNTGRTLYKFTSTDTLSNPQLFFTTYLSYNSVRDYGDVIYNPVAYETGNKEISNGTADKARVTRYSQEMSNLTNDEGKRFIYAEKVYNLTTLVYFSSGLSKSIKNSTDSEYQRTTQVSQNEEYSYKLTMANSAISVSKDIVLFDSLENYTTPSGETSNWKGVLQSIDTTQIEKAGIKPVVYASDVALDLSTFGGLTTDEMLSKFKPISEFTDYSTIKTIAIDCRKMQDGSEAELGRGKSLVSIVNMKAPASLPTGVVYKNYNNVYAHVTATDSGAETTAFINNGYTVNSYKVTGNMFVNKLNSDTKQGAQGVQFTLSGTSAYGEQVSMVRTSDSKGLVEFKKIPVGKYLLVETDSTPNYFLDDTKHIVEVTEQGEVLIDGQTRSAITLENKPRVSADIKFNKKSYPNSVGISVPVADAEFTLQGTSDYGNDVLETAKSKDDGTVEFKNIEMGTYKLFETKAPTVYAKSTDEFKVTISSTGTVTITNVTESKTTDTVYNYRRLVPISFKKINAETNEPIPASKISFKLSGQDSEGRIINQELSVDWKGVVSAEIPVGIYTIQENPNPTDSNGKSYLRDSREYILEVKKDGTFTLDMEKVGDDYVVKNTQIATDVITITKQWVGGNPNGYIPKIRIYTNPTDIPQNSTSETSHEEIPDIAEPDEGL